MSHFSHKMQQRNDEARRKELGHPRMTERTSGARSVDALDEILPLDAILAGAVNEGTSGAGCRSLPDALDACFLGDGTRIRSKLQRREDERQKNAVSARSRSGSESTRSREGTLSAPDLLELADQEGPGPQREGSRRRHSSRSMQALGDDPQALGGYRPQRRQPKASASRHNDTAPTRRKGRKKRKPKRNVTFCDMQSTCTYESATSFLPIADLFYSREDDATFSDLTVAHARSIRSYIKASNITTEETFNALTGLPSPEALQRHFLGPEDIVGIEHLLCGRGVARSQLQLKMNHAKVVLDTQQRGMDANALSKELRKFSSISSKLAACRASYATMF